VGGAPLAAGLPVTPAARRGVVFVVIAGHECSRLVCVEIAGEAMGAGSSAPVSRRFLKQKTGIHKLKAPS
ncbi:MAG: hypothetical protein WBA62_04510, partial [Xanthobacteraceae bacterium]